MIEQTVEEIVSELAPKIMQFFVDTLKAAGEWAIDTLHETIAGGVKPGIKVTKVEKELLRKDDIIQIAKDNIVEDSNEVFAWLKEGKDKYNLYLAYGFNKELLPKEKNNFVVITTDGLSRDASALFKDNELIILK